MLARKPGPASTRAAAASPSVARLESDTRSHAPDLAVPTSETREDAPVLARSLQAPDRPPAECDSERAGIGVTAKPRAPQSRRARRHDCIARTMRKPDRTKLPAVAALLLSSDLRLLVRHGCDSRAGRVAVTPRRSRNCGLRTTDGSVRPRRRSRDLCGSDGRKDVDRGARSRCWRLPYGCWSRNLIHAGLREKPRDPPP